MESNFTHIAAYDKALFRLSSNAERYFSGDPNDEPASVLLERIKAQHEAEAEAKKPDKQGRKKKADAAQSDIPEGTADNYLAKVLEECGALSERALLDASELKPNAFELKSEIERGEALIMDNAEDMYKSTNTQTNKEESPF